MASHYNPLAPLTPKQLRRVARRYVQSQFGPVLSQINNEYATRSRAGAAAIQSSTAQLAHALGSAAPQTHAIYAEAQSAQSAIDNAIAAKLAAAGQSAQADVGGQLAAAGQAPSPTNLAQTGAGAGAASFGMGSAALSRLVAEGAARENYAGQLPNIARLGGAQHGQDLALQLESGRQKDVGALRAKIPGAVSQIEQDLANREFQKAAANLTFGVDQQKLAVDSAYKGAKVRQGATKLKQNAAKIQQTGAIAQSKAQLAAAANAEKKRHNLATENAKLISNDIAKYRAHHQRAAHHGFTPSQTAKYRGLGTEAAIEHKKQNDSPVQAYKSLVSKGMPPRIAAWSVGRVYGDWLNPGDKKKLGIR